MTMSEEDSKFRKIAAAARAPLTSLKMLSFELSGVALRTRVRLLANTPFGFFFDLSTLEKLAHVTHAQQYFAGDVCDPAVFYMIAQGGFTLRRKGDGETSNGEETDLVVRELPEGAFHMPRQQGQLDGHFRGSSRRSTISQLGGTFTSAIGELGHSIASFVQRKISGDEPGERGRRWRADALLACPRGHLHVRCERDGYMIQLTEDALRKLMMSAAVARVFHLVHGLGDMVFHVPLLKQAGMDEETGVRMSEMCSYKIIESGEDLFAGENEAARLYIVLYGELVKTIESDGSGPRTGGSGAISATQLSAALSVDDNAPLPAAPWQLPAKVALSAGACVNLVPVLLGVSTGIRAAACAVDASLVLELPRASLGRVLHHAHAMRDRLTLYAKMRILWTFRQAHVPMFADVDDEKLQFVAERATLANFEPHSLIVTQSAPAEAIFFLVHGDIHAAHEDTFSAASSETASPGSSPLPSRRASGNHSPLSGFDSSSLNDLHRASPPSSPEHLLRKSSLSKQVMLDQHAKSKSLSSLHESSTKQKSKQTFTKRLKHRMSLFSGEQETQAAMARVSKSPKSMFSQEAQQSLLSESSMLLPSQLHEASLVREWHKTILVGQYFGAEQLLLPDRLQRWNATYRATFQTCTLLVLPKQHFVEFFDNDASMVAELHLKLLRHKASLHAVLGHRLARNFFTQWLGERHGARYLDFIAAAERYSLVDVHLLPHAARALSEDMLTDFICTGAPLQIVLSPQVRRPIMEKYEQGLTVPSALFQIARESVLLHLESTFLADFKKDRPFHMLLSALGSYPTIEKDIGAPPAFVSAFKKLEFRPGMPLQGEASGGGGSQSPVDDGSGSPTNGSPRSVRSFKKKTLADEIEVGRRSPLRGRSGSICAPAGPSGAPGLGLIGMDDTSPQAPAGSSGAAYKRRASSRIGSRRHSHG